MDILETDKPVVYKGRSLHLNTQQRTRGKRVDCIVGDTRHDDPIQAALLVVGGGLLFALLHACRRGESA